MGGQADGAVEGQQPVPLRVLLVGGEHDQDAVGDYLAVEMVVFLCGGQDREAVVHGVGHAGGVVHLNEVGDIAGGDDDGLDDLRQLRGDFVGLAVRHGLLAPAEDGGGAHGAESDAHGVGVGGDVVAGGDGALIVLGHGVSHTGPQVAGRGVGDDLRVDENVVGRDLGEGVFPQAAIGMVHDAQTGAGGAGGGDGGEGEEGPVGLVGQHLAGVDGLAAAHREDHVGVRHLRPEHIHVFAGGLAAVPEGAGDLDAGAFHRLADLRLRGGQRLPAADDGGLFAIGRADVDNIVIGVRAYGISRKKSFLHNKHLLKNAWLMGRAQSAVTGLARTLLRTAGAASSSALALAKACSLQYLRFLYTPTVRKGTTTTAMPR